MYKKILTMLFGIVFFVTNIYASTLIESNNYKENNESFLIQKYEVNKNEEEKFILDFKKEKSIFGIKYSFVEMSKTGGDETLNEDIIDKKEFVTISNKGNITITNLPNYIKYNENGYDGQLKLDSDNIKTIKEYDKINNEYKYYTTACYIGNLSKIVEKPYIYLVKYKKLSNIAIMPVIIGFILIVFVIYFLKSNVKIYNLQYGNWVLIKKMRIQKPYINLDKIKTKSITSKYKIELNKNLTKKLYNKIVIIEKENKIIEKLIDEINKKYVFEIDMQGGSLIEKNIKN